MKLTRRQEEFVVNLIDLNRELDGPIHYSTLAERLGVSPFTAYDMLCVLEEKGMVISGVSMDGKLVEIIELSNHPWFVACQFHPEFKSRPNRPHPLFREFIKAALK